MITKRKTNCNNASDLKHNSITAVEDNSAVVKDPETNPQEVQPNHSLNVSTLTKDITNIQQCIEAIQDYS